MKYSRVWIGVGIIGILAVASVALSHPPDGGERGFDGGSYLVTIKDSAGNFASRAVITLHADQTMSVVDSGQGGPGFFFTSQLGSWKFDRNHRIAARTIDFNYPPGAGVARLDYTIGQGRTRNEVMGTVTLRAYPLATGNPLESNGTVIGTFTFTGELIKP